MVIKEKAIKEAMWESANKLCGSVEPFLRMRCLR